MNEGFIYQLLLVTHAVAGIAGLFAFWLPALSRKGGRVHRTAGKFFLLAMLIVTVTGIPLALVLLASGQWVPAVFLLYLAILLSTSTASAWGALKLKQRPDRYFGKAYLATAWLLVVSGVLVSALGIFYGVMLLTIFGVIGPFAAIDMFKRYRMAHRPANWWLLEHFGGMIGGGIATHVAFGAFGLRRLWPEYAALDGWVGMLPWILPVVIGIAASMWLDRKYAVEASVRVA
jgi:hypothetical protein